MCSFLELQLSENELDVLVSSCYNFLKRDGADLFQVRARSHTREDEPLGRRMCC
jgi:hypothetical protein